MVLRGHVVRDGDGGVARGGLGMLQQLPLGAFLDAVDVIFSLSRKSEAGATNLI